MLLFLLFPFVRPLALEEALFFANACKKTSISTRGGGWCQGEVLDPCSWEGVTCSADNETVTALAFSGVLTGTLPRLDFMKDLDSLTLDCSMGPMSGAVNEVVWGSRMVNMTINGCPNVMVTIPLITPVPRLENMIIRSAQINVTRLPLPGYVLPPLNILSHSPSLQTVIVSGCGVRARITPTHWDSPRFLHTVDLSFNNLAIDQTPSLCTARSLRVLNLSNNILLDLQQCYKDMDPTMKCDLTGNRICEDAGDYSPCQVDPPTLNGEDQCGACGGNSAICRDRSGDLCNPRPGACGFCTTEEEPPGGCPDCSGTPGGSLTYDECGVCGGPGGCCGEVDVCGVCEGDGSTCEDCAGIPLGTSTFDACNICGGEGRTLDVCNICNGDGTTCLDCLGVPNGPATYDRCDVCGGTGDSCGVGAEEEPYLLAALILSLIGLAALFLFCTRSRKRKAKRR